MPIIANKEFSDLFYKVTGLRAEVAAQNEDGWVFIPPSVKLGEENQQERKLLSKDGWKNHLVEDEAAGWWVKPWTQN